MRGYIGITDHHWYQQLLGMGSALEEVNFWQPSGGRMARLEAGTPFFFKLHKRYGDAICGFGFYARGTYLSIREAWSYFGLSNGVESLGELRSRVARYRRVASVQLHEAIGCHLLVSPVFFPEPLWVPAPSNWSPNIVQGRGEALVEAEMNRIWQTCLAQAIELPLGAQSEVQVAQAWEGARFGAPRLVAPRLGQGTFRAGVLDAYGRACAVTREHSIPVLEAAHIQAYGEGGVHDVSNGLLLRSDLHKLFDAGYVTVTPDARFEVSRRLKDDFDNGRVYYAMHGSALYLPEDPAQRPREEFLRWHNEQRYLAA